ncbi:hypothetical protein L3X38_026211 [Prunus dulcis]|uniref:Uncharacterized protein n=1 Tax=Prunus dulcis TaxID=3755 RepID=A0AAD4W5W1_PRUDU|nr:hypothetical protein L3X38_026211 [Prunus dulcis]
MAALAVAPIDPDTPSFDGYESGGSSGHRLQLQLQLEDTIIPDTCDEDNQFDALCETDAEPKFKSSAKSNDNSAQEVIQFDPKKNKTKNVASNTEKKSPSSTDAAAAAAAKEKRPREGLQCNASVAKKMKKKNVKKEAIPEIDEDAHVAEDDQVVEKKKKQHIKKKKKKNSVSGEEMKTSNDCADHEKVEEKKEEGGFVNVMKACERYLASHVVDWRWIKNERMVKLEKMWVKLRGAESVFRSLQADFDAELHRVALDAYISYEDCC